MTTQAGLSVRIRFHPDARLGPGKIALLEAVQRTGSVKQAGASLEMSARRAWLLLNALNTAFNRAVVVTEGEPESTPASVTELGEQLILAYRAVEADTDKAVKTHFAQLQTQMRHHTDPA